MKKILTLVLVVGLAAFVSVPTAFAGGFQLNEHGARALGQAGAFAARANDLSAIYFNPAGLAFIPSNMVYAGTTIIMPQVTFYKATNVKEKTNMVEQIFPPINVYGAYKIAENMTVALGVNNPFGLGTEWAPTWVGKYITTKIDLQSFFFTPTFAYQINDQLSVGIGANYVMGTVLMKRFVAIPFDSPAPEATIDLNASGYGFNGGLMYKFTPELSLGLSYRSSVKLEATGTAAFSPNYVALNLPAGDVATTLTLPATGFAGLAYKPMENLEVELDYQFVGWSSYKELAIEFKKDNSKSVSPKNYEDCYIIRFGAEYTMNEFQFRAGYLFDRNPVKTEYVEPLLPDANRNGISAGVGYKITEDLFVDAAYLFLKFDQRKAENTEIKFDGTYNATANLFGVNVGYRF